MKIFHPKHPARGRKRRGLCLRMIADGSELSPQTPRKGTETVTNRICTGQEVNHAFTPNTPQGDGNSFEDLELPLHYDQFFHPKHPARGRKPWSISPDRIRFFFDVLSPQTPRKGTETSTPSNGVNTKRITAFLSPQTPRKGTETGYDRQALSNLSVSLSPQTPRKGTETKQLKIVAAAIGRPSLSPQTPRKGTETLLHKHYVPI